MPVQNALTLLKKTFQEWQKDNIATWSAGLSYYAVFAVSPLLLLLLSLTGLIISPEIIQKNIAQQLQNILGPSVAHFIIETLSQAKGKEGILATLLGFIFLVIGVSGVFTQLKATLNHIFKIKSTQKDFIKSFIKEKIIGFLMILLIGILLALSLTVTAVITFFSNFFVFLLPVSQTTIEVLNFIVSFITTSILFILIYKVLSDIKIPSKLLLKGGVITALLFTIGKTLLGLYLGSGFVGSGFGAASSLAFLLIWIYYSSLIFFFGAELIKVYAIEENIELPPKVNTISLKTKHGEDKLTILAEKTLGLILSGLLIRLMKKIIGRGKKN